MDDLKFLQSSQTLIHFKILTACQQQSIWNFIVFLLESTSFRIIEVLSTKDQVADEYIEPTRNCFSLKFATIFEHC